VAVPSPSYTPESVNSGPWAQSATPASTVLPPPVAPPAPPTWGDGAGHGRSGGPAPDLPSFWGGGGPPGQRGAGDPPTDDGGPPRLELGPGGGRNRLTVFLRPLLVFPHVFVLGLLGYGALVLSVVGWVVALVTGRLPAGIHRFLRRYVGYGARIYGYVGFLTDQYPPFDLPPDKGDDYPVRAILAPRGRLNRALVLFRAILVLPASILGEFLALGAGLLGIPMWLVVLLTGRSPRPIRQAIAGVVQFYVRLSAYGLLLTDAYPGGLFADVDDGAVSLAVPAASDHRYDIIPSRGGNRTGVSLGARALIVAFILAGFAYLVAAVAIPVALGTAARAREQLAVTVAEDYHALNSQASQFDSAAVACRAAPNRARCVQDAAQIFSGDLSGFAAALGQLNASGTAQAGLVAMASTADAMAADLTHLVHGGGQPAQAAFQDSASVLDQQYQQLLGVLGVPLSSGLA
jgi:hypothetical protein